ncbi:amino acid ABC transporter substrate-binding protein [Parendozoicomonas sp. Alg238-R29]|uniref:amino acid ABC transporter substrate-binding protein n=1 Tax=Parendozoicomonas sp. Alg238-R29 TaxID=2993446 RepID=UPI00248EC3FE|nr:amino acid ABC transporter substrate-binding protein [Parendozoicomonas sp. Alg238-R29]
MKKAIKLAGAALALTAVSGMAQAATLDSVKERGYLQCGVSTGLPGFSSPDEKGNWTGIDVDVCRAMAAATLGDASKVKYVPLTAKERFTALQSGEIDVLSRNTTWTQTRDTSLGLNFVGVNYYDGQGFMVNKSLNVSSAKELDGATVCIQAGTTTELNMADYFRENKMTYQPLVFDTSAQTIAGFETGRCDMLTSDQSQLYALRTKLAKPADAVVLPEVISKEPLGPVVRQGDDQWLNIAKWSLYALVNGEELGLTSTNIETQMKGDNPAVSRFIGKTGPGGKALNLPNDFAYQIVKQVGNYDEVFERNVGAKSPLLIKRGINALWKDGGIVYAPPFR